jgi:hypothetical protein
MRRFRLASLVTPSYVIQVNYISYSSGTDASLTQNILTICWVTFSIVLFSMPTAVPLASAAAANFAPAVFVAFTVIAIIWYAVSARKNYFGPNISSSKTKDGVIQVTEQYDASEELQSDDSRGPVEMPVPMRA